jgi:hypothetical protein
MASHFLGDEQSRLDLESRIKGSDREIYQSFGHLRLMPVFDQRLIVLYKPTGLTERGQHRDPDILTTLKVIDLIVDSASPEGAGVKIEDLTTGQEQIIGYVPERLFSYDVFASIPPLLRLRWDAKLVNGSIQRSLAYGLLLKTKNRSDFYSARVTYAESPNDFRSLYPGYDLQLRYL